MLVGLTLPILDEEGTENVLDFVASLYLCSVTNQFCGGSPLPDAVFQCVDKLLICANAMNVNNMGVGSIENNSSSRSIINSRSVRIDNVTGNWFGSTWIIEGRIGRPACTFKESALR